MTTVTYAPIHASRIRPIRPKGNTAACDRCGVVRVVKKKSPICSGCFYALTPVERAAWK